MINAILTGIINLFMGIVNILLLPIDALIAGAFPDIANMLNLVNNGFDTISTYFGWILDGTLLSSQTIAFFIICMTFHLTIPYLVHAFKFILKWYRSVRL